MGSNTDISVLSLIPYWITQWQTKQSPLGASSHGVQSVEHGASLKHPWYGCFTQTWPCSFWPGSSKMWNGVGHFHADAQFQHYATSPCDTRGKVEIKLSLCIVPHWGCVELDTPNYQPLLKILALRAWCNKPNHLFAVVQIFFLNVRPVADVMTIEEISSWWDFRKRLVEICSVMFSY